jgi:hypothetical protein
LKAPQTKHEAWLQLFRPPNLFTVPGDPIAGFLIAGGAVETAGLIVPAIAALSFYSGGLLLNDLVDIRTDSLERPERPIPSGMVRAEGVWLAALLLFLVGLGISAMGGFRSLKIGVALLMAIIAYNAGLKGMPVFGVVSMGICRSASVLLGAAFTGAIPISAITASIVIGGYIAAVTEFARHETRRPVPQYARWLPVLALVMGLSVLLLNVISAALIALALAISGFWLVRLSADIEPPIPVITGALLRNLLLIQAAFCAVRIGEAGVWTIVILLLAFWPMSYFTAKRYCARR